MCIPLAMVVKRFELAVKHGDIPFKVNVYLVYDIVSRDGVIIDPGNRAEGLERLIEVEKLNVVAVLNTHGHFDHSDANIYYSGRYGCKVYGSRAEEYNYTRNKAQSRPDVFFDDGDDINLGVFTIRVIQTPGHSRGSSNLLVETIGSTVLFTGDNLFKGKIGRTWPDDEFSARQKQQRLINGIKEKLFCLDGEMKVYPGHGDMTTIEQERLTNRYLK